ncbi:MAG: PASTA domain-containing protein [Desulfarculus sp.]|nr:PASTA domain-containing protein [Desulfarculus sp.]
MNPGTRPLARLLLAAALALALALAWAGQPASAASGRATVPDVKGKQVKVALRMLKQEGFDNVNVIGVDTDKRGLNGVVQSQIPPAGAEVHTNATVKLSVYEYSP